MPYTCTWSHNSTAITMVNQPVLNQEWDFSLGAERSHNEGTCRQGWGAGKRKRSTPTEVPSATRCLFRLSLYIRHLCTTHYVSTHAGKEEECNGKRV